MHKLYLKGRDILHLIPSTPRYILVSVFFFTAALFCSGMLNKMTGEQNNTALVYVLAVVLISLFTSGYVYGIVVSLLAGFCNNYFFMYPYSEFSLSLTGYPMTMLSMVTISCIVCALTTRGKLHAEESVRREQRNKALYELNESLNAEKLTIQLEKDRETIRSNILRSVSHDLRTPLTAISGSAAVMLSSEGMRSEKDTAMLEDIRDDADSLIAMVENLLSITRIRNDNTEIKKQNEMLEEVVGDAVMKIHRRFPDVKVELTLCDEILFMPMDPLLIKQVVLNLLENSIRHSGSPDTIHLSLFCKDGWGGVEVRDCGRGLSDDVHRAILEGRQLSSSTSGDSSRGMGIGLSVCQSIIQVHDGFFTAHNHAEGGAVFRFGLPLEEIL